MDANISRFSANQIMEGFSIASKRYGNSRLMHFYADKINDCTTCYNVEFLHDYGYIFHIEFECFSIESGNGKPHRIYSGMLFSYNGKSIKLPFDFASDIRSCFVCVINGFFRKEHLLEKVKGFFRINHGGRND